MQVVRLSRLHRRFARLPFSCFLQLRPDLMRGSASHCRRDGFGKMLPRWGRLAAPINRSARGAAGLRVRDVSACYPRDSPTRSGLPRLDSTRPDVTPAQSRARHPVASLLSTFLTEAAWLPRYRCVINVILKATESSENHAASLPRLLMTLIAIVFKTTPAYRYSRHRRSSYKLNCQFATRSSTWSSEKPAYL